MIEKAACPRSALILAILMLACGTSTTRGEQTFSPFTLLRADGTKMVVDAAEHPLTVLCFLGTECPLAKLYAPRLNALAAEYSQVQWIGINSNRQDSLAELTAYQQRHELKFPLLKDHANQIADRMGAERTPEVFVLDSDGKVQYRGRIDDQYQPGISRAAATRHELRDTIVALLANQAAPMARTEAVGCLIGRVRKIDSSNASPNDARPDVTYCRQVARILQQHCVDCHRQGEIGPFALDDYNEVVGWADMMLEVIDEGRMPPWHASPDHGEFQNARHMPAEDRDTLRDWVEAGTPYGDASDLPAPLPATDGWRLGRSPDLVLQMSKTPFVVPAEGTVEYQYFVVDPGFTEDKWISGAQVVPGNASVVHHTIVFVRPPDGSRFRGLGWISAYVPGARPGRLPPGHAIHIPAGSKLVLQQHYTPTGSPQSDCTKIGLTFAADKDVTHEVYTLVGIDQDFEIPPQSASYEVRGQVPHLPPTASLLSIMPHMHLRGKAFRLDATLTAARAADDDHAEDSKDDLGVPDTVTETLLEVPRYDFNWQHAYRLTKPLPLDRVNRLSFQMVFDNSDGNPTNPDATQWVGWGDQTWEEMAVAFFEVAEPRELPTSDRPQAASKTVGKRSTARLQQREAEHQKRMAAEATRMLKQFDANGDGYVARDETPTVFRRHAFGSIDENGDDRLDREEIQRAARWRVR